MIGSDMEPIRYIRKCVFDMSQADFAAAIGVTQPTIFRWEKGKLGPRSEHMAKIRDLATARGVPFSDDLFFKVPDSTIPGACPTATPAVLPKGR